jgi:quinoprotein glucose dehydrogenase
MHKPLGALFFSLSLLFGGWMLSGQAEPPAQPYQPRVAAASKEGELALKRIQVPKELQISLYAAEPLLANPVCFCFDHRGNCYVAETFRLHAGVTDDRGHMYWLDDDLAARTVADRLALYRKHLKGRFKDYEREHDRVRMLVDTDGDGKADRATVFADGFHRAQDGIGAGLLAHKGSVYYTCIPDLWRLKDTKGTGKADVRESLSTGYGVHVSFIGHDMHGLRLGPDGKLYFSIGDRGLNVRTKEGYQLVYPDTGAVLRCDPDGANLEVVATGLRNPQELAFDDYGNLFTVDNNSDAGDRARLVYVVEGGDSGWRIGYQYDSAALGSRGPWHYEKLWHLPHEGQPAYIVPPLAHFTSGPSGLTHYPGVGLPDRYAGHFFVCDFRGNPGGSGVWSFAVKPKGAAFELADPQHFVWSVLATDCEFGPDGAFYVSDWVDGWGLTGKGRLYRVTDPEQMKKPVIAEVKKLLAEGFDKRPVEELVKLLGHPHQQVRLEAQFALAAKGREAIETLAKVARESKNRLARLHALWGLGMVGRKEVNAFVLLKVFDTVEALAGDSDAEVRAHVAKVLGSGPFASYRALLKLLADPEPRVCFQAGLALGVSRANTQSRQDNQRRAREVFQGVTAMLRDNADRDPYLRHAGVMALAAKAPDLLKEAIRDESAAVRLAVCLALHRNHNPALSRFLADPDVKVMAEAARAIHDVPIPEALPPLAALCDNPRLPPAILLRALNAHFRLGKADDAVAVGRLAADPRAAERVRVEALKMLGEWARPGRRDRVTGLTQDLGTRPAADAAAALRGSLAGLFSGPNRVRQEASRVAARLGIKEVGPALMALLTDRKRPASVRVEALRGLDALHDARLEQAVELAVKDEQPVLRHAGRAVLARLHPKAGLKLLDRVLREGESQPDSVTAEQKLKINRTARQGAFAILGTMKGQDAEGLLGRWMDDLLAKKLEPGLHLDLLEAARASSSTAIKQQLARFEAERPRGDHLTAWREALVGGDAEEGRRIFLHKAEVSCLRCHKVAGQGGDVGPDLSGIGARQNREYLLESLVDPNRQIAKGFETVVLTTTKGKTVAGIVKAEDRKSVKLMTAEGKLVIVAKKDIDERQTGKSAMPDDVVKHLSRRELRDLVEFLASLTK